MEGQSRNSVAPIGSTSVRGVVSDSDLEQQYLNLTSSASESPVERRKDPNYRPVSTSQLSSSEFETREEETNESSSDFGLENMGDRTITQQRKDPDDMEMYQREISRMGSSAISRSADSGIHASEPRLAFGIVCDVKGNVS